MNDNNIRAGDTIRMKDSPEVIRVKTDPTMRLCKEEHEYCNCCKVEVYYYQRECPECGEDTDSAVRTIRHYWANVCDVIRDFG